MKRKFIWKVVIVLFALIFISFSDYSFAASWGEDTLGLIAKYLHLFVSMLSWIWIFFAQIAWEFLTNKWVYWELIWLDAVLWKLRNLMKNIANFGLWFYFVYTIFNGLVKKEDLMKKIKDTLLWILVAWVWIQASWFFVAAVVDVSTITLAVAGWLWSQIVADSNIAEDSIQINFEKTFEEAGKASGEINEALNLSLFSSNQWWAFDFLSVKRVPLDKESYNKQELFDLIMPSANNVSWPLYYLWTCILGVTNLVSLNTSSENWIKATIFNILLQSWTTIIYSIEMLVLCILAIMRVVYMWIFIVLSPIVILIWCIQQSLNQKWWNMDMLKSFNKHFNITSFLWNAFKPAIIVLWFSLALIFVSCMWWVISSSANKDMDIWWVKIWSKNESSSDKKWDAKWSTSISWEMVELSIANAWKTLWEFLMSIITVFLVYYIIRIAVLLWWWSDFVSKGIEKVQNSVWKAMSKTPLVPVAWYDKDGKPTTHFISVGWTLWLNWKNGLLNEKLSRLSGKYNKELSEQTDRVNALMWWWTTWISNTHWSNLGAKLKDNNITGGWLAKLKAMKTYISDNDLGKYLDLSGKTTESQKWINLFKERLENTKAEDIIWNWEDDVEYWKKMVEWFKQHEKDADWLQKMFEDRENGKAFVKAYANLFGIGIEAEEWNILKSKPMWS